MSELGNCGPLTSFWQQAEVVRENNKSVCSKKNSGSVPGYARSAKNTSMTSMGLPRNHRGSLPSDLNKDSRYGSSPSSNPSRLPKRSSVDSTMCYKTRLCGFWLQNCCLKADKCPFAHSLEERRTPPNLRKTKICLAWSKSHCAVSAEECPYAHGEADLNKNRASSEIDSSPFSYLKTDGKQNLHSHYNASQSTLSALSTTDTSSPCHSDNGASIDGREAYTFFNSSLKQLLLNAETQHQENTTEIAIQDEEDCAKTEWETHCSGISSESTASTCDDIALASLPCCDTFQGALGEVILKKWRSTGIPCSENVPQVEAPFIRDSDLLSKLSGGNMMNELRNCRHTQLPVDELLLDSAQDHDVYSLFTENRDQIAYVE